MKDRLQTARASLFLLVILTVVNCVLVFFDSNLYFLFSATIPYLAIVFGAVLGAFAENALFMGLGITLGVVLLAAYAVLAFFAKRYRPCLIIAAILMIVDTIVLLLCSFGENAILSGGIVDILFHVWVLFDLFRAFFEKPRTEEEVNTPIAGA